MLDIWGTMGQLKWPPRGALGQLNRALQIALPGHCCFCLGETQDSLPWCEACFDELPWNRHPCTRCAEPLPAAAGALCGRCLRQPPPFDTTFAPLRYEGHVAALTHRFKFAAQPRAGEIMARLFTQAWRERGLEALPEALIAVPLHTGRARERGFDQTRWLAQRIGAALNVPLIAAQRMRLTDPQRGLSRRERQRNLRDAFVLRSPLPAHVVLLDDVMTTGATLGALAKACRSAGAGHIEAWAIARTPALHR
ncbi:double zinc ribbon domain-containing protein [Halomonas sp. WWR20]